MPRKITYKGKKLTLSTRTYDLGGIAVILDSDDGVYAILSICVGDLVSSLGPNAFVLHHDIQPPLIDALLASGFFLDTGRRANYGYVTGQPVWKLLKED